LERVFPPICPNLKSISTGVQYVTPAAKFIVKKSKCAGLVQEMVFLHQIRAACRAWQRRNTVVHRKECNKLLLTAAQYF
jgi:hypothetical protein